MSLKESPSVYLEERFRIPEGIQDAQITVCKTMRHVHITHAHPFASLSHL